MPTENRSSNTEQMVSELLPCPFCKAAMHIESNRDWHRVMGEHDEECVFLDPETMMVPATDEQRELLVRDWNRRKKSAAKHQGEPVACAHEWNDDGEFMLVCTACGAQENHDPKWRDMSSAPRDGTLLRLLVAFEENSTEDDQEAATIGANNFENDGEDTWQLAGWCWTHDHFTSGKGEPVGWLPMLDTPHAAAGEVERLRTEVKRLKQDKTASIFLQRMAEKKVAERDALLRRCLLAVREQHCDEGEADFDLPLPLMSDIDAALSASAEPKCQDGGMCADSSHKCTGCARDERDERADFEADQLSKGFAIDLLPGTVATYMVPAVRFAWAGWQARAALECKP